jgi:hypothetical protein
MINTKEPYAKPKLLMKGNLKEITFSDARYQSSVASGD